MNLKTIGITFSVIALLSFNGWGIDDSSDTTTNEVDNIAKSSTLNYELVDGKKKILVLIMHHLELVLIQVKR